MQRLANLREKQDREEAKRALREAEKLAREAGSQDLWQALWASREHYSKNGKQNGSFAFFNGRYESRRARVFRRAS